MNPVCSLGNILFGTAALVPLYRSVRNCTFSSVVPKCSKLQLLFRCTEVLGTAALVPLYRSVQNCTFRSVVQKCSELHCQFCCSVVYGTAPLGPLYSSIRNCTVSSVVQQCPEPLVPLNSRSVIQKCPELHLQFRCIVVSGTTPLVPLNIFPVVQCSADRNPGTRHFVSRAGIYKGTWILCVIYIYYIAYITVLGVICNIYAVSI